MDISEFRQEYRNEQKKVQKFQEEKFKDYLQNKWVILFLVCLPIGMSLAIMHFSFLVDLQYYDNLWDSITNNVSTIILSFVIGILTEVVIILLLSVIADCNVDDGRLKKMKSEFISFYKQSGEYIDFRINDVRSYDNLKDELVKKSSNDGVRVYIFILCFSFAMILGILAQ